MPAAWRRFNRRGAPCGPCGGCSTAMAIALAEPLRHDGLEAHFVGVAKDEVAGLGNEVVESKASMA